MNKNKLERFIQKYSLGDNVNSVKLDIKDNVLNTRFLSEDKSLHGDLTVENFDLDNSTIGIFNTNQLNRLIGVLGEDIKLELAMTDNKPTSLKMTSIDASVNYILSDLSVIPAVPDIRNIPEFDLTLNIDSDFINTFVRGKNALSEVETFVVIPGSTTTDFVIGYSSINSNRVTIPLKTQNLTDPIMDDIEFNANIFKEILVANKECENSTFEISSQGLMRMSFNVDDFDVTYFLVSQQVD